MDPFQIHHTWELAHRDNVNMEHRVCCSTIQLTGTQRVRLTPLADLMVRNNASTYSGRREDSHTMTVTPSKPSPEKQQIGRRELLKYQAALWPSLSLSTLLPGVSAEQPVRRASAIRSCIVIFYYGGPSHLDTFDMKPEAPAEIRGEFQPVQTNVPGLQISEHLPFTAQIMDKVALIRSVHHTNRLHDSASTETLTGRQSPQGDREEFAPIAQFYPCYGATLNYLNREIAESVPHAALPWIFHNVVNTPCQGGGFLGRRFDPLRIDGDPQTLTYQSHMLQLPVDLSLERIATRRSLLDRFDALLPNGHPRDTTQVFRDQYQQAYSLLRSDALRHALDIDKESHKTRETYGLLPPPKRGTGSTKTPNAYGYNLRGQNLLMARRLVEMGVPFVNVYDFKQQGQNWDSHADNFQQHKNYLLPPADRAFAALIKDLDQRGLLESTLVIAMGEFGRTPRINAQSGRDHWPDCYTVALAGGGVQGGAVWGASDKLGSYPLSNPVTPADLAATIYWRFGLDPQMEIHDPLGRPYRIAEGAPLRSLFSG